MDGEKKRERGRKRKNQKKTKKEQMENIGHQLENVGRIRSREEKKNVEMKQNEKASSVVRRSAGNF